MRVRFVMSLGFLYFKSSVSFKARTVSTCPLSSLVNCSVLGSASGSSATMAVENCDKNLLCASDRDVPNTATPTYTSLPTISSTYTVLNNYSDTTIAISSRASHFLPYRFHFGSLCVILLPLASTITPIRPQEIRHGSPLHHTTEPSHLDLTPIDYRTDL